VFFTEDYLTEVLNRNRLEDVVSRYTVLSKHGNSYKGLCPFHSEKTPSFTISEDKQLYYCFGCSSGGTTLNFIMQIENFDFVNAVKYLAEKSGMPLPQENNNQDVNYIKKIKYIYEINKYAALFFYQNLIESMKNQDNLTLRAYLKERQLNNKIINKFGIGYSDSSSGLLEYLTKKNYSDDQILESGLTVKLQDGTYVSRFKNRLMFPIIDGHKRVLGFGGRTISNLSKCTKYINSPETLAFEKKKNLFGLQFAKKSKGDYIILVEGYMDVVTLHKFGISEAVANLGTAFTQYQAKVIKKLNKEVILAYDNDLAGKGAIQRAANILIDHDINVKILELNNAKDPDEYIKKFGPDKFEELICSALPYMSFIFKDLDVKYFKDNDQDVTANVDNKYKYINSAAIEIAKFNNLVQREVYISQLSKLTGISKKALEIEISKYTVTKENNIIGQTENANFIEYKPCNKYIMKSVLDNRTNMLVITEDLRRNIIRAESIIINIILKFPDQASKIVGLIESKDFIGETNREIFETITSSDKSSENIERLKFRFGEHFNSIQNNWQSDLDSEILQQRLHQAMKIVKKYSQMRVVNSIVKDQQSNIIDRLTKLRDVTQQKTINIGGGCIT